MSTGGKFFLLILLLPFLGAVGHDVHYSYFADTVSVKETNNNKNSKSGDLKVSDLGWFHTVVSKDDKIEVKAPEINPENYKVSDLGWVWKTYYPENMKNTRDMIEPEVWKKKVDPILQYPTFIVALVPFAVGCIFCVFALILGVWPFTRKTNGHFSSGKSDDYAVYKHAKGKATKYSRK